MGQWLKGKKLKIIVGHIQIKSREYSGTYKKGKV